MNNTQPKINVAMLSDFLNENEEYDKLVSLYYQKLTRAGKVRSKEEFMAEELARIKRNVEARVMITSLTSSPIKNFIDFTIYSKHAYDWLSAGEDYPIANIVNNFKSQYSPSPHSEADQISSVVHFLKVGAAYLLYEKFLKDAIAKSLQSIKTSSKSSIKKKRKAIPQKIRAKLQQEIHSVCPFCGNKEVDHFEIHHIDENPENNSIENLLMLCPICHSKITKGDISKDEVIKKKKALSNNFPVKVFDDEDFYSSASAFKKRMEKVLLDKNSEYYNELKEHWNSYSLIKIYPFLNELINTKLSKSIHYGLLSIISDFARRHLYYDREEKYIYNQPHQWLHNKEDEGFDLPIYYHIKLIGILYATAIINRIDIDQVSVVEKNMISIYSSMIEGMIENMTVEPSRPSKEYPTNYHWLIMQIFWYIRNWISELNEAGKFIKQSSYAGYIALNLEYCITELYKGVDVGKVNVNFLSSCFYYGFLSEYFSPKINSIIKKNIEENVISEIPKSYIEPIFRFALNEAYAIRFEDFEKGHIHLVNHSERKIVTNLRNILAENELL